MSRCNILVVLFLTYTGRVSEDAILLVLLVTLFLGVQAHPRVLHGMPRVLHNAANRHRQLATDRIVYQREMGYIRQKLCRCKSAPSPRSDQTTTFVQRCTTREQGLRLCLAMSPIHDENAMFWFPRWHELFWNIVHIALDPAKSRLVYVTHIFYSVI